MCSSTHVTALFPCVIVVLCSSEDINFFLLVVCLQLNEKEKEKEEGEEDDNDNLKPYSTSVANAKSVAVCSKFNAQIPEAIHFVA